MKNKILAEYVRIAGPLTAIILGSAFVFDLADFWGLGLWLCFFTGLSMIYAWGKAKEDAFKQARDRAPEFCEVCGHHRDAHRAREGCIAEVLGGAVMSANGKLHQPTCVCRWVGRKGGDDD